MSNPRSYRLFQILWLWPIIWHIIQVNFIYFWLIVLYLLASGSWILLRLQKNWLCLSIWNLLHYIWASWCWLSHLGLTCVSGLSHLVVQNILAVTLLRAHCQSVVPTYLLVLELLALSYVLVLFTSSEALPASTLALSCSCTRLFCARYHLLCHVSLEKILSRCLIWTTFEWAIIIKLVVLLLCATVSCFVFINLACSNEVLVVFPKARFW